MVLYFLEIFKHVIDNINPYYSALMEDKQE